MLFQSGADLGEVLVVSRFDCAKHVDGRNVGTRKRAIVHTLLNARARGGDLLAQTREPAGTIANSA